MLLINIINYLLIFNIFSGAFVLFRSPFEFYFSYIFIIIFLFGYIFFNHNIYINRNFLLILMVLTAASLVNICLDNDSVIFFLKQAVGILMTGLAYYLLIKLNNYDIDKLFRAYLLIAIVVAALGIFQEFSFLVGFKYGYDYRWLIKKWLLSPAIGGMIRVNSIFPEPSHLIIAMAPAFLVALVTILKRNFLYLSRITSLLIIACYILTFSSLIIIAFLISLLIILSDKKYKYLFIFLVSLTITVIGYYFVPEIYLRINHIFRIMNGSLPVAGSHLTIYAYVSNAFVAFKSFIGNPFFGRGLGSHPLSYDEFIYPNNANILWQNKYANYAGVNRLDANSLFLRLVSETGLLGIIIVFYFIFRFRLKHCDKSLGIISNATFVLFILQLIRQGHYFYNGLFFFVWVYYFAYKIERKTV